jgi:hypothetical protein
MSVPLDILYPNGKVEAVQVYIWSGGQPVVWDGSVTVSVTSSGSAIQDGVTGTIKATVLDKITGGGTANPLAVLALGTTGNPIAQALEGGNLATIAGVVTSARAAVNPISGQVGVTGGSGVVGAAVQRVVLATDVALPSGTNLIGYVGHGKTPKAITGTTTSTTTVVAAVTSKKIKAYSLSLLTLSTVSVTVTFKSGASGTALATYLLQAPTSVMAGLAEAVTIPSSLFETAAGSLLEMALSGAVSVTYNLRYWDDDAT